MTETIQRAARAADEAKAREILGKLWPPLDELAVVEGLAAALAAERIACIETLLDPSEEAVKHAAARLVLCAVASGSEGDQLFIDMAYACIRAYHMTILGREE